MTAGSGSAGPAAPDVPLLVVGLTITMGPKNDYHLGPFLTDQSGSIRLGVEEVEGSIRQVQRESLMDYSPIDLGARPKFDVDLSIMSKRGLRSCAERLKPFFPERSERLDRLVAVASNPEDGSRTLCLEVDEGTTAIVTPIGVPLRDEASDPAPVPIPGSPSRRR